jgi:hypothetical protein
MKRPPRFYLFFTAILAIDLSLASCVQSYTPKTIGQVSSVEFGSNDDTTDFCDISGCPSGGVLVSMWTKVTGLAPVGGYSDWLHTNMNTLWLKGDRWKVVGLVGNVHLIDGVPNYNANFMVFATTVDNMYYGGDFCTNYQSGLTTSIVSDWVWVAWQAVVNPDKSVTFRQWVKFGIDGPVLPAGAFYSDPAYEEIATRKAMYDVLILPENGYPKALGDTWNPTDFTSIQIGQHDSYLCHVRIEARSAVPTTAYLDTISRLNAADPSAWADYELNWVDGAPNLKDRSGHHRDLTIHSGGVLKEGPLSPSF